MPKRSAGLVLFRRDPEGGTEILLVHPGGPLWARRDLGSWSIPKGEYGPGEDPLATARREFEEETGLPSPPGAAMPLGDAVQAGGKVVTAFAVEGDLDPTAVRSNTFRMEWPPRSGRTAEFPEVDRAAWFAPAEAAARVLPGQRVLLERLLASLPAPPVSP